jgi:hypothetical protein
MRRRARGGTHLEYAMVLLVSGLIWTGCGWVVQGKVAAMRRVHAEAFR